MKLEINSSISQRRLSNYHSNYTNKANEISKDPTGLFQSLKTRQRKFIENKDLRKDMVDDLKRISESREIAQSSSLSHTTIDYDLKS